MTDSLPPLNEGALAYAADTLRRYEHGHRCLKDWDKLDKSSRDSWIAKATSVVRGYFVHSYRLKERKCPPLTR
jgi:hypothetical protein